MYPRPGRHLVDATEPLTFTVEPQHAKGSIVGDPENCAGACALRSIPGVTHAWVRRSTTWLQMEDGRVVRYRNPRALQTAVENFDSTSGLFPPGQYVLRVYGKSQKLVNQRKRPRGNRTGDVPKLSRKRPAHAMR